MQDGEDRSEQNARKLIGLFTGIASVSWAAPRR